MMKNERMAAKRGTGNENKSAARPLDGFSRALFCYILPPVFVAAIAILAIWGSEQKARAEERGNTAENYKNSAITMYQCYFNELADTVYDMEISMSKLMVTESRTQYVLALEDIWRDSGTCVAIMSRLPQAHGDAYQLNEFLVRIGDYSRTLTKNVLNNKPISDFDKEQLMQLYTACASLTERLRSQVDAGDIPVEALTADAYYSVSETMQSEEQQGGAEGDTSSDSVTEYPTLIYDGPFAESTEKSVPEGVIGELIAEEEALEIAKKLTECELKLSSYSAGEIPSYDFEGNYPDGRYVDISITEIGGHLLWFMSSSTTENETGVPEEDVYNRYVNACTEWLDKQGFTFMVPTYAQYYSGSALICFAATQNDVIIYNDLIKVWIDTETLEIIGADTRNYLYSHVDRTIENAELTISEAEEYVSDNLDILSRRLALIPLTPGTETLCYEFKGKYGDDEYIIYINAETGAEEQIFRVLNSENGQLVV